MEINLRNSVSILEFIRMERHPLRIQVLRPMTPVKRLSLFLLSAATCLATTGPTLAGEQLPLKDALKMARQIDALLEKDLKVRKVTPLPTISDEVFVRRSYVNIVGRIPTAREAREFLESESKGKRVELIESLVTSPGYDSSAFNYFADLLRLQTTHEQYGLGWHVWLRRSLAEDKPWNLIVNEMLSAEGHSTKNPAVGYYLRDRGMLLDNVSNTVQVFLGHQIGCAQCHDHPFDKWTQMEYYELAAFSGGIEYRSQEARKSYGKVAEQVRAKHPKLARQGGPKARRFLQQKVGREVRYLFRDFNRNEISESDKKLSLPDDYQYKDADPGEAIEPATLFGKEISATDSEERRKAFANWVTASDNPYFTKVIANRLWDRTFGHGLVDPIDDWNSKSKGSHPEVLAYLEEVMKKVGYRTRDFERVLYHTRLFQREASTHEATSGTDYYFVGPQLRRLSAEELYDSFTVLTFGNTDDNINTRLEEKWEEHIANIDTVLTMSGKELLTAGRDAQKAEEERRKYQSQLRNLQLQISKAKGAGDEREARRLRAKQGQIRSSARSKQEDMGVAATMVMRRRPGREARASLNMRASEHPSPFRADHFVRQFGGSDRNVPESAHTDASIPQALTLLNGMAARSVEDRRSRLYQVLSKIKTPYGQLDFLFLSLYACRPTEEERKQFLPIVRQKDGAFTLARAMLTSKRYLFLQ